MITLGASEFKAKCLGLLSAVEMKRETVTVTKHGRPVAKLIPLEIADEVDPLDVFLVPGVEIVGDIEEPLYTDEEWEGFFEDSVAQLK